MAEEANEAGGAMAIVTKMNGTGLGPKYLKISDLSRLTGVPISTLRYWCDHNLLAPHVTPKGHRYFEERHVEEASAIHRLRKVQGLSIAAVKSAISPQGNAAATSNHQNTVGEHLRNLRLAAKMTLRELSSRTGIDRAVLASIERTSLGTNIPEAKELARFFGMTLTELMIDRTDQANKPVLTPASGGPLQPALGSGMRIEQMASGRGMMDCQRWFIEPGISSHGAYDHEGEEFIYVLAGQLSITIEGEEMHTLSQGESIYFRSTLKHSWSNPGRTVTILLWVNTPPSF